MTSLTIDGSFGEGGGQMLRTSLTLSLLTGKPFRMVNIRAGREKPGLRPQHIEAVRAAQRIGEAQVEGASEGSMTMSFVPGQKVGGADNYRFEIRTAGSTMLVLQTIFLPLALVVRNAVSPPTGADPQPDTRGQDSISRYSPARIVIGGGTHVEWSPSFHYVAAQWLPMLKKMGFDAQLKLNMAGFYPRGGGEIECVIRPLAASIMPIRLTERGAPRQLRIISAIGQLPLDIAERQKRQAEKRLAGLKGYQLESENLPLPAPSPGKMLLAMAEHEHGAGCFCALGAKGKRAERVADEACDALLSYLESDAAVDEYLADQLVLPAVLAEGESCLRIKVTQHLLTNLHVMRSFLPTQAQVEGEEGEVAAVRIVSNGIQREA
jgi:RNA 3'-terminal phosphate cyclase (ATP)